jgi:DnaJ-class molecular chaperone
MTHYDILGLSLTSTKEEIKKAYKQLALVHHPDRGGDEERFKKIGEAYETLVDDMKRQQYDLSLKSNSGSFPFELMNLFAKTFIKPTAQRKPVDLHNSLSISFEESILGCVKSITLCYQKDCTCVNYCKQCNGFGTIDSQTQFGPFVQMIKIPCMVCNSTGKITPQSHLCNKCNNKRVIESTESISITIPSGIPDKWPIRIPGKGQYPKNKHDIQGDLIVTIQVIPYSNEQKSFLQIHRSSLSQSTSFNINREKNDLIYKMKVSLKNLLIGDTIQLNRFGETIDINIGIQQIETHQIRLPGKGITWQTNTGDLVIDMDIIYPSKDLTSEEKKQLKQTLINIGW